MKRNLVPSTRLATILLAFTGLTAPTFAQQAASQSGDTPQTKPADREVQSEETVVVTARRREDRIADVPAAINVLGQQGIADRGGLVTLQDIANNVPSVNFAATSTPATAEISMRGSGTARSTNAEGGVSLYRNSTYVGGGRRGGRSFTRMDFFVLERIETLRGV